MSRLSVKQAALHARVCESIIRRWVAAGLLPHFRLGTPGKRGKIVIDADDLDGVLASFKVGTAGPEPVKAPVRKVTPKLRHLRLPSA